MDLALPPMPFSAVFYPLADNAWMRIPPEFQVPSATYSESSQLELPAGVVQVIVTWQGAESLYVRHYRGDYPEVVATIPGASSGTMRSTGVLTLVSDDVQAVRLVNAQGAGNTWSTTTFDREYVAGVQVMPMGTAADVTGGGSMLRVDNSVGTRVFLGDQMIHGDTGWRNMEANLVNGWKSTNTYLAPQMRRLGDIVHLYMPALGLHGEDATHPSFLAAPQGFRPVYNYATLGSVYSGTSAYAVRQDMANLLITYHPKSAVSGTVWWRTSQTWPTTLPGTAVA